MPELNANIPPIECYVRGNFLRNQLDSHDKYFRCMIFGVCSAQNRSPLFHFLMEDGCMWWRMPINAFCTKPNTPEESLQNLVVWNSFDHFISVTKFTKLTNMRLVYTDRDKKKIDGKYLFTLDWYNPYSPKTDDNYLGDPGQRQCAHVIERDDGNFAIQPNNRIFLHGSLFINKPGEFLIDRLSNSGRWDVEDPSKWTIKDANKYSYDTNQEEVDK